MASALTDEQAAAWGSRLEDVLQDIASDAAFATDVEEVQDIAERLADVTEKIKSLADKVVTVQGNALLRRGYNDLGEKLTPEQIEHQHREDEYGVPHFPDAATVACGCGACVTSICEKCSPSEDRVDDDNLDMD